MTTYIYFVKCPGCEDEHFDFFDEAKEFALGCLSQKPIITQTEVERNDFGECTDSADLGTVWSWEDIMGETDAEPAKSIFTKDDLKPWVEDKDSEFDSLDNSLEFPIEEALLDEAVADDLQPGVVYTLKDDAFICEAEDSSIKGFLSNPNTTTIAHVKNTYAKGDDIIIPAKAKLRYVKDYQVNNVNYQMFSDGKVVFLFSHSFANHLITEAMETRKPVPEGMTIEQLVEEMEENEDTVECTWCNDLFDKDQCRYEVDLGWLCSRCEAAIKSRGETLTFKENNYWDFLDENHKPITWICEFDGKEIGTVEAVTEEEAYEAMENKYPDLNYSLYDGVAIVYPADKNELTEASLFDIAAAANSEFGSSWNSEDLLDMVGVEDDFRRADVHTGMTPSEKIKYDREKEEERAYRAKLARWKKYQKSKQEDLDPEALHDLGNEYDGGYPAETPEVSNSHLKLCPECGKETFDIETGICIDCGFN